MSVSILITVKGAVFVWSMSNQSKITLDVPEQKDEDMALAEWPKKEKKKQKHKQRKTNG